jgi:transposase
MLELKAYNINTKFAILDAGYLGNENMKVLYNEKISFLSPMNEHRKLYQQLITEHIPSIETEENLVRYNSRYAYVCQDIAMKGFSTNRSFAAASAKDLKAKEIHTELQDKRVFILFSSRPIAKEKILPTYYTRQQIEQIFDIGKNYTNMLPLRVHTEEIFRGHLFLTFISSVIVKMIQDDLKDTVFNPTRAFLQLKNQQCKVFDNDIIPQEAVKKVNDIYKKFTFKSPKTILRNKALHV